MINIDIQATDESPICPHCLKELTTILKNVKGSWERHVVYICPHCKKILGIGNDIGMGS